MVYLFFHRIEQAEKFAMKDPEDGDLNASESAEEVREREKERKAERKGLVSNIGR